MSQGSADMKYRPNEKHKSGCAGDGPPRWFPTSASRCPDDVSEEEAAALLRESIEARDDAHPNAQARVAVDGQGRFFKAYSEDGGATWHGYPVDRGLVPRQVPSRVLRQLVQVGRLSRADYKKLLGSAR